ncbi:hypothetical protein PhCBS80983_g00973 [Powellomyces hirtus]|uniref:Sister chromatid cohesion protein n=1 Tax=Powellomyces hirtus TaxID=109895 RepID=A0A507EE92_9FUNG|nr:hypothetical protein PhCBS80983_g00973 [Powellomyces hirtus]
MENVTQTSEASHATTVNPTAGVAAHRHLVAMRQQPLASLTPVLDAGSLLPTLSAASSIRPTLLDHIDPRHMAALAESTDDLMNASARLLPPDLLAAVNSLLAQADVGYLRLNQSYFERPEDSTPYREPGSVPDQPPLTPQQARQEDQATPQRSGTPVPYPQRPNGISLPRSRTPGPDTSLAHPHLYPTPSSTATNDVARASPGVMPVDSESVSGARPPFDIASPSPMIAGASRNRIYHDNLFPKHNDGSQAIPHGPTHGSNHHTAYDNQLAMGQDVPSQRGSLAANGPSVNNMPVVSSDETSAPPSTTVRRRSTFAGIEVVIKSNKSSPEASPRRPPAAFHPKAEPMTTTESVRDIPIPLPSDIMRTLTVSGNERGGSTPVSDPAIAIRKLTDLTESILAEQDAVCDLLEQQKRTMYFDGPLLSADTLKGLHKYLRRSTAAHTSAKIGQSIEKSSLKRLSRLLEARMKDGEFLQIPGGQQAEGPGTPKKKKRKSNVDGIQNPPTPIARNGHSSLDTFEKNMRSTLSRVDMSLNACRIALGLFRALAADDKEEDLLTDSGFSEELVGAGVSLVKTQLNDTIYAVLDLLSKDGDEATPDVRTMQEICEQVDVKGIVNQLIAKINDIMVNLRFLLERGMLGDEIVTPVAFVALSPFFVDAASVAEGIGLSQIQMRGIDLCQTIFARYVTHRNFILDEISVNLIKLSAVKRTPRLYRLADGRSIQMVTALILQLLHSCCSTEAMRNVASEVLASSGAERSEDAAETVVPRKGKLTKNQQKEADAATQAAVEKLDAERQLITKFTQTCKSQLDAASQCALYLLKFLLNRSVQNSTESFITKDKVKGRRSLASSNEAEYKGVLENLIRDLLLVYNTPEWPAADMAIMMFSRLLVQSLDDVKKQGDTSMRALAIEWLGAICAKLRTRQAIRPEIEATLQICEDKLIKCEIGQASEPESIRTMWSLQKWVADWLETGSANEPALKSAQLSFIATWGSTISVSTEEYKAWRETARATMRQMVVGYCAIGNSATAFRSDLLPASSLPTPPDTAASALDTRPTIHSCVELLSQRQPLYQSFDQYLLRIGAALDSDVVTLRAKALKALQEIFIADPTVLSIGNVRKIIQARMMDQSTSVRDAAIELVGKFLITGGAEMLIMEYYPMIADRILDVGINVRKRIVRLVKDIYPRVCAANGDAYRKITIDIAAKLMLRLADEEDSVKDLAFKALQELWLVPFPGIAGAVQPTEDNEALQKDQAWGALPPAVRGAIRDRAMIMVAAVAHLKAAPDSYSQLLDRAMQSASKLAKQDLVDVCRSLIESLMEEILCLEEKDSKTMVMNVLTLIHQFSKVVPSLVSSHVKTLHTYLGSSGPPNQSDGMEQRTKLLVILILKNVVPVMRNPDIQDLSGVETDLAQALSNGAHQLIGAAVPCLCTIISDVTHHYDKLTKILKKCIEFGLKTKKAVLAGVNIPEPGWRATWRSLLLASLFVRHFDFDKKITDLNEPAQQDLNGITSGSVVTFVCEMLLFFVGPQMSEGTKSLSLGALGNMFIAYPRLMLRTDARALMDIIFSGESMTLKVALLKAFGEYLHIEQARDLEKKKSTEVAEAGVDIKVLIGNADEMGDAGISSSIMQTYLNGILSCMLTSNQQLTHSAFDLVELVIEQGLVHPLLCMPAIVAMEANASSDIRDRAGRLHTQLNEKHASFINAKNMDCVKCMFQYVGDMAKEGIKTEDGSPFSLVTGYLNFQMRTKDGSVLERQEPMLGRMFGIVQSKRPRRNEFLVSLVKLMDVDLSKPILWDQITLCRFIAENLALIEYKTQEEVLQVIYHAYRVLSVTGETVLREIEKKDNAETADSEVELPVLAQASVCVGMLLVLKTHLQSAYTLSAARISSFKPNEGPRSTEKPAVKASGIPSILKWEKIPFALKPMDDGAAYLEQCHQFKEMMHQDYLVGFADGDVDNISLGEDSHLSANVSTTTDVDDGTDVAIVPNSTLSDDADKSYSLAMTKGPNVFVPSPLKQRSSVTGSRKRKQSSGACAAGSMPTTPTRARPAKKRKRLVAQGPDSDGDDANDEDWK